MPKVNHGIAHPRADSGVAVIQQNGAPKHATALPTRAEEALNELSSTYWQTLYIRVRRRGHPVEEAQDLTQEFFARLLQKHWLANARIQDGQLRSFLFMALHHFLAKEFRKEHALKRGNGRKALPLDGPPGRRPAREPMTTLTPLRIMEQRWAKGVFVRALARLRHQYVSAGKRRYFDILKLFLTTEAGEGDYTRAGRRLKLSNGAVAAAVHRLRQRYGELVRQEVSRTVDSREELKREMQWLVQAVR